MYIGLHMLLKSNYSILLVFWFKGREQDSDSNNKFSDGVNKAMQDGVSKTDTDKNPIKQSTDCVLSCCQFCLSRGDKEEITFNVSENE